MTIHPMLTGAHAILYSQKPDEDRAFLRDVLGLPHVDAGEGWLIFSLPPAEANWASTSPAMPGHREVVSFQSSVIR
jgi:hypothetical protein